MIENDNFIIKYNGILFKVSVCNPPKSKPQYEKMLVVKLVDPSTGHIMQDLYKIDKRMNELKELIKSNIESISEVESAKAELDRLKSGNSNYFISGNVYVMHDEADMETLRKKAYEKARQLYCANSKELCKKITDEAPRIGEYNANNLYQLYFSRFKKSNYMKRCSPSTAKLKDRIVREACEKLSAKRVCDLKEKDISELFSEKKFQSKKHLIEDFFEFCRELDAYNCPNPIKNYFSSNPGTKFKKAKKFYPTAAEFIPLEIERNLYELVCNRLDDSEIMAIILPMYANCSLSEVLELKWKSFDVIDNVVIYKRHKDGIAGPIHNFTVPIMPDGSALILKIRNKLLEKYNGDIDKLNCRPVICISNPSKNKAHLTKYIRDTLKEAGLDSSFISAANPNSKEVGGSGVTLLNKHFKHMLTDRCGIEWGSDEFNYICGNCPDSVLARHYRSFSDNYSGLIYLKTVLRRGCKMTSIPNSNVEIKEECDEHHCSYMVSPGAYNMRTVLDFNTVYLPAGTEIEVSAPFGIQGEVEFLISKNISDNEIIPSETLY